MPNNTDLIPHRSDDEATSLASTDTQPNLDESQVHPVPHTEKSPEAQDQADHHETYRHTVEPNLGRLNELEDGLSSIESQHSGPQELSHLDGLAQNQHQSSLAASKSNATSMKSNRVPLKIEEVYLHRLFSSQNIMMLGIILSRSNISLFSLLQLLHLQVLLVHL